MGKTGRVLNIVFGLFFPHLSRPMPTGTETNSAPCSMDDLGREPLLQDTEVKLESLGLKSLVFGPYSNQPLTGDFFDGNE